MIKTYKARVPRNNVSYLLYGKQGNEVRFNFTDGNININKYPTLTLRGRYFQELLEDSLLFKGETVVIEHEQEEFPDEKAERENETNSVSVPTPATPKQPKTEEVRDIYTSDEVIAYINDRFDKECKTLATAMKHASKAGLIFPDFNE